MERSGAANCRKMTKNLRKISLNFKAQYAILFRCISGIQEETKIEIFVRGDIRRSKRIRFLREGCGEDIIHGELFRRCGFTGENESPSRLFEIINKCFGRVPK